VIRLERRLYTLLVGKNIGEPKLHDEAPVDGDERWTYTTQKSLTYALANSEDYEIAKDYGSAHSRDYSSEDYRCAEDYGSAAIEPYRPAIY